MIKHICNITNDCDSEECECEVGYDIASYYECKHCCSCEKIDKIELTIKT